MKSKYHTKNVKIWIPFQTFRENRENLECVPNFLKKVMKIWYAFQITLIREFSNYS